MGAHSSGLCLLSQLSLLPCFIYWGGGRWGEPPTIGPPMRCPRARPGCVLVLVLSPLALRRSSASLSCLPVLGLGGTEEVSQLFPRGEDVRLGPAFGLWRLEAPG